MTKIRWKSLVKHVALPLAVGGLAALLTRGNMAVYDAIVKPAFAPPPILFPIVWTVLYVLMGVSTYLLGPESSEDKSAAKAVYLLQLLVNFFWPILFFNKRAFLLAFIWLVLLWILIGVMIWRYERINRTAAFLQIPYWVWVTFAGALNFSIYWLNR